MPVKRSVQKANNMSRKMFKKFNSTCFGDYRTPFTTPLVRPFSCSARVSKYLQTDELYNSTVNKSDFIQTASCESCLRTQDQTPLKCKRKENANKEKKPKVSRFTRGEELAHKMKELDMIDGADVEHVLDLEEALHYYSRLKSPEYLDIVDNFFMDMYYEFSPPQPSSSFNGSKRRFGSVGL